MGKVQGENDGKTVRNDGEMPDPQKIKAKRGRPRKNPDVGSMPGADPESGNDRGRILNRMIDGFNLTGPDREIAAPILDHLENSIGGGLIVFAACFYFVAKYVIFPWFKRKKDVSTVADPAVETHVLKPNGE